MTKKGTSKPRTRAREAALPIVWTDRALADLEAIGEYIARDNPRAAARWIARFFATVERVAGAPLLSRRVPEIDRNDVRETFLRTYRLVYRVAKDRREVLTVFEGHRLFPAGVEPPGGEGEVP